jgi:hypothetical protein
MRGWWMEQRQLEKLLADARAVAKNPQNADRFEREHVQSLINQAASSDEDTRDNGILELTVTLAGWSSKLAIDLVRTRAPAQVRQALVASLPEMESLAEPAMLALLDDPLPGIRQLVVEAFDPDLSDTARARFTQRLATERDQRVRRSITALLAGNTVTADSN